MTFVFNKLPECIFPFCRMALGNQADSDDDSVWSDDVRSCAANQETTKGTRHRQWTRRDNRLLWWILIISDWTVRDLLGKEDIRKFERRLHEFYVSLVEFLIFQRSLTFWSGYFEPIFIFSKLKTSFTILGIYEFDSYYLKTDHDVMRIFLEFDQILLILAVFRQLKDWFRSCARGISSLWRPVEWVTPLGLPVLQPYVKALHTQGHLVHKPVGSKQVNISLFIRIILSILQVDAFPPNFVHSLDSTHMMLTSLHCSRRYIFT